MTENEHIFGNFSIEVGPNQGYLLSGGEPVEGQPDFVRLARTQRRQFHIVEGMEILKPSDYKTWAPRDSRVSSAVPFLDMTDATSSRCFETVGDLEKALKEGLATPEQIASVIESTPKIWEYILLRDKSTGEDMQISKCEFGEMIDFVQKRGLPKQIEDAYVVAFLGSALSDGYVGRADKIVPVALEHTDLAERAVNYGFRAALVDRRWYAQTRAKQIIDSELGDLVHPVHKEHTVRYLAKDAR